MQCYNLTKEFNCLPHSGGIYEQDAWLMYGIQIIDKMVEDQRNFEKNKKKGNRAGSN